MSQRRTTLLAALAPLALLGVSGVAAPAYASPSNANTFLLELGCSDGSHPVVTLVDASDDAAAAHVVDGHGVIVPTAFSFHITVRGAGGAVIDDFTTPWTGVHGTSGAHLGTVTCTFHQTETEVVPDLGEVTVDLEGAVEAFRPR
jgi:hypothetical protein